MHLTTRLYNMTIYTYQLVFLEERYSRMAHKTDLPLIRLDRQLGTSAKVSKEPMNESKYFGTKPQRRFTFQSNSFLLMLGFSFVPIISSSSRCLLDTHYIVSFKIARFFELHVI